MSSHCQVTLDSSHVFFADSSATGNTYIMDWEEGTFEYIGSLAHTHFGPCGKATSKSRGQEIVVAANGTSEIFSLETLTWREGKSFKNL